MSEFTAIENVMTSILIAGKSKKEARARADELLEKVNLSMCLTWPLYSLYIFTVHTRHWPNEMSTWNVFK
jgi:alpha-D-ribose 1-methylphosphonate 5-triphosphate synthase subunit PhnL